LSAQRRKQESDSNSKESDARRNLAAALKLMENANNSDYEEAIELLKVATKDERDERIYTAVHNNIGLAYCNLHKFSQAIESFKKAIDKNPHYSNAYNNLGLAYYYQGRSKSSLAQQGDYWLAVDCFNKAIDLDKNDANALNNKGKIMFELGWHDEGLNCINDAIKISPNNANVWNNKGHVFASQERNQEAIKYFNKALEINPEHAEAWNNKANVLSRLARYSDDVDEENSQFEEAIECYDKALQFSNLVDALNNKALLLSNNGENKAALRLIKEWSRKNLGNENTKDIEGLAYYNLNKLDRAFKCFDTVTTKNNSKTAWYHKGNVKLKQNDPDAAIECYNQALRIDSMFAEAHNSKAIAYYRKKEHAKAIAEASRAIEIKPSLAAAEENYAKLSVPINQTSVQNFWEFWNSTLPKKIVGVLLGLALALIVSFSIFMPAFLPPTSMLSQPAILLPIIGIILLILLIPEIKKAKMGPLELELKEQQIHATTNASSLSENIDRYD